MDSPPPAAVSDTYLKQSRGPDIIAASAILIAVPTLAVIGRLWTRYVTIQGSFWWDDWALIATLLSSNVFLSVNIWWTTAGLGRHAVAVPMSRLTENNTAEIVSVTWYAVVITFLKLSALALYARLFQVSRSFRWQLWVLGTIVTVWGIVLIILPFVNCHPVEKYVNPLVPGTCLNVLHEYEAMAVINFVLDFTVLLMPMPVIWKLQMGLKRKVQTTVVFVFGYCSAFLSFARFIIIIRNPDLLSNKTDPDISWNLVPLLYLSMLEAPFGIIALCGPNLNHLFQRARTYGVSSLFDSRARGSDPHSRPPQPTPPRNDYANFDMPARNRFGSALSRLGGGHSSTASTTLKGDSGLRSLDRDGFIHGEDIPLDSVVVKRDVIVEPHAR